MQNIYLIGPRASGKTSVGKLLAKELGVAFMDTDLALVEQYQTDIATLVEREGWPAFRRCESAVLAAVSQAPGPRVVATGGGVVLAEANCRLMRARGTVFYLAAPAEELARRLAAAPLTSQRPSLTGRGLAEEVAEILARREEQYRQTAHYVLNALESPEQLAAKARELLSQKNLEFTGHD